MMCFLPFVQQFGLREAIKDRLNNNNSQVNSSLS